MADKNTKKIHEFAHVVRKTIELLRDGRTLNQLSVTRNYGANSVDAKFRCVQDFFADHVTPIAL